MARFWPVLLKNKPLAVLRENRPLGPDGKPSPKIDALAAFSKTRLRYCAPAQNESSSPLTFVMLGRVSSGRVKGKTPAGAGIK